MPEAQSSSFSLSALDARALSDKLQALAGAERNTQADFLLHLEVLDRRRGYVELGYPSLWEYCLRALHLREGAAGRRIGAMRVLRRFPSLVEALRGGRLSLSTICVLGPVLTADNVEEIAARAAFRTKAETDAIAASVKPRAAPADGLRRLTAPSASAPLGRAGGDDSQRPAPEQRHHDPVADPDVGGTHGKELILPMTDPTASAGAARRSAVELSAVAAEEWSLRVTLDAEAKRDLETLKALLAHKIPSGNLAAVLREALRCAIQQHGVRRGALAPVRRRSSPRVGNGGAGLQGASGPVAEGHPASHGGAPPGSSGRPAIPAEVRRQVWARDGGRCSFEAPDGLRCESRWMLELDHVVPWSRGGSPTVNNLRLRCRAHNLLHAERTIGRDRMELFRRERGIPAH